MSAAQQNAASCVAHLNKIDVEDLDYLERDLSFHEMVSLGFLLFGEERSNAAFILQKILVISNSGMIRTSTDLLRKYATINAINWRALLVEALAIIDARHVLRKLGFNWEELRQHYLPHIAELSLHVHPLLKALYKICERLTPMQAGRLVAQVNGEQNVENSAEHLRFYDHEYLEVFILDWITRRVISVGDHEAQGADVLILLQYFKLNEWDELKKLLIDTINSNTDLQNEKTIADNNENATVSSVHKVEERNETDDNNPMNRFVVTDEIVNIGGAALSKNEFYYKVDRDSAGYIIIINQRNFYEEPAEEFKHLLPSSKLKDRRGTDVDQQKLQTVFSSFGYKVEEYVNLSHIDMLSCIREIVKRSLLQDSLIVCLLSHGIDGAVYGANSIPVKISEIETIITAETLQGKPKMLIVQACQKDEGGKGKEALDKRKGASSNSELAAHAFTDVIKAMSTVSGFASMRHTETGTWFIQSLCNAVDKFGDKMHMLDILVTVTRDVTNKRGDKNEVMVPQTSNTLTKFFVLPSRTRNSLS